MIETVPLSILSILFSFIFLNLQWRSCHFYLIWAIIVCKTEHKFKKKIKNAKGFC